MLPGKLLQVLLPEGVPPGVLETFVIVRHPVIVITHPVQLLHTRVPLALKLLDQLGGFLPQLPFRHTILLCEIGQILLPGFASVIAGEQLSQPPHVLPALFNALELALSRLVPRQGRALFLILRRVIQPSQAVPPALQALLPTAERFHSLLRFLTGIGLPENGVLSQQRFHPVDLGLQRLALPLQVLTG